MWCSFGVVIDGCVGACGNVHYSGYGPVVSCWLLRWCCFVSCSVDDVNDHDNDDDDRDLKEPGDVDSDTEQNNRQQEANLHLGEEGAEVQGSKY